MTSVGSLCGECEPLELRHPSRSLVPSKKTSWLHLDSPYLQPRNPSISPRMSTELDHNLPELEFEHVPLGRESWIPLSARKSLAERRRRTIEDNLVSPKKVTGKRRPIPRRTSTGNRQSMGSRFSTYVEWEKSAAVISEAVRRGTRDSFLVGPNDSIARHSIIPSLPRLSIAKYEGTFAEPLGLEGAEEEKEDEAAYLSGMKLVVLTVTLMLGQFLMGLDATVITTAIPKITADFHSLDDVGWYGSAYLLTTVALLPSFGKVYTFFDIKLSFIASVLVFEAGSVACALARNSPTFILGRAVAGIGQAAMVAGGTTVVGYCVPIQKRAMYFALLTSMNGFASIVGPPLGGFFTDSPRLTWRFCFWINVPLGALVIGMGLYCFQQPVREPSKLTFREKLARMDLVGASLFIASMVCLFLALKRGGTQYPWSDSRVWGCLLAFGLLLILFTGLQIWLGEDATIPPHIIARRTVVASCLYTGLISVGFNTHAYFLPFYFQSAKGVSAEVSGLRLIPYLASLMVIALVSGALLMMVGICLPFMWFGSIVFTIASGFLTTLKVNSSTATWAGYELLAGTGFGSTLQIAVVAIQAALPAQDQPVGSALFLFSNYMGGALGISIAENIFTSVLKEQLVIAAPGLDTAQIISAGATAISTTVPSGLLSAVLEAYNIAISRAFLLPTMTAAIGFLCTFGIEWKNFKKG